MEAHAAPSPGRPKACAMPLGRGCLGTHSEVKAQGVSSKNPGWLPGLWPHGGTCCTTTWQAKTVCNWVGGAWRRTQKSRCRASPQNPRLAVWCWAAGVHVLRHQLASQKTRAMQLSRGWRRTHSEVKVQGITSKTSGRSVAAWRHMLDQHLAGQERVQCNWVGGLGTISEVRGHGFTSKPKARCLV